MPVKSKFNDKARSGGLAKAQAVRDARKHGRRLPQGEAPKSKKQKRIDKYVDTKLRNDEKVKLMKILGDRPRAEGMENTKAMKRTKGQDKKQVYDMFTGFDDNDDDDDDDNDEEETDRSEVLSDDGENLALHEAQVIESPTATKRSVADSSISFGFSAAAPNKRLKTTSVKYNWRAKLEEDKRKKAGIKSDSDEASSTSEESDPDDSEIDADDDDDDEAHESEITEKRAAFKDWARIQTDQAPADFSSTNTTHLPEDEIYVPRPRSRSPETIDTSDLPIPSLTPVLITRPPEMEQSRAELPAYAHEQEIVETIKTHSTVIISGATGSGKTTQIPQFLYEAGFTGIGITQPRRVAAVSMARRIATELGEDAGRVVGYKIRFESSVKDGTHIKLMTDGVLLREVGLDFLLSAYQVIIIDEAHERSINTDILIGVLSRIVRLRRDTPTPLRLVIMSATLRVSDFSQNQRLFPVAPPIMSIEARQYPVSNHFSRRTEMSSYVEEAVKKVCKIHEKLPPGGILVFLTGQQEIQQCAKLLQEHFGKNYNRLDAHSQPARVTVKAVEQALEVEDYDANQHSLVQAAVDNLDDANDDYREDSDSDLSDIEETEQDKMTPANAKLQKYVRVLPLYSLLPTTEQMKVFEDVPLQTRKIILATNVAETSLTIPDIRYVVDSGRAKVRRFQGRVQSFEIDWISKASADQRSGRAGRTGPGHAYRLFSSAVYDASFPLFSDAEILNTPIEGIVLQMKSMNIHTVTNFPFPTAPDRVALANAENLLKQLGALDAKGYITDMGRQMSLFPIAPRYAKMIVIGNQGGVLPFVIALVAVLSIGDPFIREQSLNDGHGDAQIDVEEGKRRRQAYFRTMSKFSTLSPSSDAMRLLMATCAYDFAKNKQVFCQDHFLRAKAMDEICKLRQQITAVIRSITSIDIKPSLQLQPPNAEQVDLLHKILCSAFLSQLCIRADLISKEPIKKGNISRTPYIPLQPLEDGAEHAFVHSASISINRGAAESAPKFLLYSSLSAVADTDQPRIRMHCLCSIEPAWIHECARGTSLVTYGKPVLDNMRYVEMPDGSRGLTRVVPVVPTIQIVGSGRKGWELPIVRVNQTRPSPSSTRWETSTVYES